MIFSRFTTLGMNCMTHWTYKMSYSTPFSPGLIRPVRSQLNLEPRLILYWFVSAHASAVHRCWGGGGAGFRPRYFCLGLLAINRHKGVMVWPSTHQDMVKIFRCCESWLATTLDAPNRKQWRLLAGSYNMGSVCEWANITACESEDWYVQADIIINFPCRAYAADTNSNRNGIYIFGQMSKTINIFWH